MATQRFVLRGKAKDVFPLIKLMAQGEMVEKMRKTPRLGSAKK
jgi:hypothetical protein